MKKRVLSVLTALIVLCAVVFPVLPTARAASYSGQCGENLTWTLDTGTMTMTIQGSGSMWVGAGPGLDFQQSEYFKKIKTLVISGATNIASNFAYMDALETVKILDSATIIQQQAFMGCKKLKTVQLPSSLETIEFMAFEECTALTAITIPSSIKSVGKKAFYNCDSLKTVSIPSSITSIGESAFSSCDSLENITVAGGIIGDDAFSKCYKLESATISAQAIGARAFQMCSKLQKLTLNDGVLSIGKYSFDGCSSLTKVVLPVTVKSVAEEAFMECPEIKNVTIPSGVQTIGSCAFGFHYYNWHVYPNANLTIHGEVNTEAQRYADANGFKFVPYVCFCDVPADAYYANAVSWAVRKGITGGVDSLHFGSKKTCTREQIVTFLYAAAGRPGHSMTDNPFRDVKKSKYYYDAVMWAVENGVTGGVGDGTKFGVGVSCTREQAVTFLWKAKGSPEPAGTECSFTDVKPRQYYYKAVLWAVENGVTGGVGGGRFGVGQTCTRAQIVTFLYAAFG